ncbi:ABC-type transport auxiliary lipoprotein family protein [Sphingomonas donggukensis]|uniref:ABC-type transport auxiliary lipoprotein family protein n=1 Tax=Sphingomonas donggukensis TaxID=2949093 RepID=A0ABY4TXQ4_9SPHN|nr:ABC-type transport auxiliary lipoprotein family protein [Sphingomonas donggukensis]URW75321.1 ABC-type transport auxiliary lipoprotein family protein [Sphingomonas donggukensis]
MTLRPALSLALTAAVALPLSGCISFGAKPPPSLLTLSSATPIAAGTTQRAPGAGTITIAVPTVPQEIASLRVPVRATDTSVAYLKDAQWVEPPNRLFARLLSDAVTARTGRVVIGSRMMGDPGATLNGELRSFGVDAATSSAVVTFDAAIIRTSGGALEKRRFEARVPVAAVLPNAVGVALNQGANQVAAEVADWVGR